jgi:hypothetical protein
MTPPPPRLQRRRTRHSEALDPAIKQANARRRRYRSDVTQSILAFVAALAPVNQRHVLALVRRWTGRTERRALMVVEQLIDDGILRPRSVTRRPLSPIRTLLDFGPRWATAAHHDRFNLYRDTIAVTPNGPTESRRDAADHVALSCALLRDVIGASTTVRVDHDWHTRVEALPWADDERVRRAQALERAKRDTLGRLPSGSLFGTIPQLVGPTSLPTLYVGGEYTPLETLLEIGPGLTALAPLRVVCIVDSNRLRSRIATATTAQWQQYPGSELFWVNPADGIGTDALAQSSLAQIRTAEDCVDSALRLVAGLKLWRAARRSTR